MADFDRLPLELRQWMATAKLPWRAGSVEKTYQRAIKRTGDPQKALRELDQVQDRLIARDALQVWGEFHPDGTNPCPQNQAAQIG